ncbi:glycoside hydrolase family 15 protein [Actinoalloteichus sp. AHMU CJ021]|uniref:glycoside hydrolase family 15 protein n=1 Tax=Actinoalloteichus TaxID=65496 RepID=UPI00047B177C|nr:glycoside hydrolase family 15 protein [Actinoalloteichus caeruleus]AUS78974.1 glycoside hydrolase family 15 protein [Actinoalloteichus sp. AHMU CJ021]
MAVDRRAPGTGWSPVPGGGPGRVEDYALLSDLRTAALVGRDGSVDWLCLPRFDAGSCFARLLGDHSHGYWALTPTSGDCRVRRRYRGDSLVLETEFETPDGQVLVVDAMPPAPHGGPHQPVLVRSVTGLRGSVEMEMRWVVRFSYGAAVPWVRRTRKGGVEGILAVAGPDTVVLRGDPLPVAVAGARAHHTRFPVSRGRTFRWSMQWSPDPEELPGPRDVAADLVTTERFWRTWAEQIDYDGPYQQPVRRSLLTLKALTYGPSGGMVAAPTTSLPERLGGVRNWDYRYCWLRDATLTLLALDSTGCHGEAAAWRRWLRRAVAGDPGDLQIAYGIRGERQLVEWTADWLPGYEGSRPVRIGNAAHRQLQLDVYGEVMDALHLARERGLGDTAESWEVQRALLADLETRWRRPDHGLWEVRGPARRFTHSRVMTWVAFDRAVRAVEDHGLPGPVDRWRSVRDRVREEVLTRAWNPEVGAFTQYYGSGEVDAATLLMPAVGFLPATDPRMASTIREVETRLRTDGLLARYATPRDVSAVDGLPGGEGAFLACSFWHVDALALGGRVAEATEEFERLLGHANDVGLLAEEYDPASQRLVGNFPQAFSHLALVNSAILLSDREHGRHHRDRRRVRRAS